MGLLNDISNYIREGETENQNLGLEIEHFVVDDHGNQIGFHEITELISQVGQSLGADIVMTDGYPAGYSTATYAVSLEPACQFEISIYPYSNLDKIRDIYDDFINLLGVFEAVNDVPNQWFTIDICKYLCRETS